ncbi:gamma-glutamyltransferase [Roseivirga pacifica]|uniref:gamma-glutamyltransferase n=1 Tax=Roseivirga pacifica TaxID=1267423 RepID=UPI0020952B1D|nr:gamma-glutamyltransferase [Roseivirga pacifica]MCO6359888.1 gamma-glutamyltransferase [Roseivirga pacifica]MCO6367258.1 gamma-glutamyltransferase [Roseivirga pacifica]MCO6370210.1 gamma-glutamyltransferase [Roseivirga pacifica]MCO6374915.1 gamma-glutamyltransferase [Roseivirga pacifica]MCO6380173.1 gamma-glutamyltransferase [Roseivirga pacifica]
MKKLIALLILAIAAQLNAQDRITGKTWATRSEVIAQHGMAATSQPLATQVALDILKKGGNAIDAAIAANAVLGLVEPTGNGVGGDLFAIIWDAETEHLYGLNASGRSPYSLSLEYFKKNGYEKIPAYGPLPVSVPGAVDGWFEMHGKFGSMEMQEILQPAIDYANNGFPVSELIAWYMEQGAKNLARFPGFKETYMPNGRTPRKGEVFKNPGLANTLDKIAKGGRDAFYKGDIAKTVADYIEQLGGFLSEKDFADHTSEWVEPVSVNYRGYDVWELPPNGQGIAALQMLQILEQYDIKSMGFGSKEYIHTFTEAKKLAFEDRAKFYADMDFYKTPVEWLISDEYAKQRKQLIKPNQAGKAYPAGQLKDGDTIYMTVADKDGSMVSLIQSNYRGMGSGMTPPGLGFILQDRGELFSLEEGHANVYEPHKRPFHTIIPAFITKDGKPFVSFGLMGGATQPQGHAQIVINLIDFGMNLQEAGDAPRILHNGSSQPTGGIMTDGGVLQLESGIDYEVIRELVKMGHKISWNVGSYGGYQAIMWDDVNKVYYGASESRKDGQAAGY